MERLSFTQTEKQFDIRESRIDESQFVMVMLQKSHFENVDMRGTKIMNANLSDLEIEGAQIGGAFIHNVGMPAKGHPLYDPAATMRPVRFDDCNLQESIFSNCNLKGVTLSDCNVQGMTISGIAVDDLLKAYRK